MKVPYYIGLINGLAFEKRFQIKDSLNKCKSQVYGGSFVCFAINLYKDFREHCAHLTFNCGFICEHLLFVQYKKSFEDFIIFFRAFSKFYKKKNFETQTFEIWTIHKPSQGSSEVPHKILAWSVQPFIRDKQTDKQSIYLLSHPINEPVN